MSLHRWPSVSDASDDTDGDEDEDEGDEDERDEHENKDDSNRCIISAGRIKKVYEEGCLQHRQGLHAEVKFDDDDGPRDIPLTLEMWDPLLNQALAKKWVLLKPGTVELIRNQTLSVHPSN